MTLIIANATRQSQIVVADRLVTEKRNQKPIDEEAYKILLYVNERQRYRFGIGYAGLAEVKGKKTADWLCAKLPEAMNGITPIGLAIPAFADVCTREVFSRESLYP